MSAIPVGYKQTEVGLIPLEWTVQQLGGIATIATGNTPPTRDAANYGNDFLFVSPADLGDEKHVIDTQKRLSREGFALSRCFPKNSILFVCIGSTIGKCGVASIDLTTNQQINVIFPSPAFSTDYLYYAVCASASRIRALAGEQAVPIVNKSQFSETSVSLPSLPEQRAIGAALSDVDALLAKLDQLIAKKRDLKQAAMQQLLTGQSRLPGFSGPWEVKRLGDALRVRHGKSQHNVETPDGRYPILATGGEIGRTDTFLYDKPSVLIGRKGTIDKPQFRDEPFWTVDTLFYTEILGANSPKFLFYKFCTIDWRSYNEASGVPSLNASTIESIEAKLPRSDEQTAIATVLSDMDAELAALEARRDKTRALKQGMMQELLTGRIRLV